MNNEPMQEAAATIHVPHVCRTWNDALDAAEAAVAENATRLAMFGFGTVASSDGEVIEREQALYLIRSLKEK